MIVHEGTPSILTGQRICAQLGSGSKTRPGKGSEGEIFKTGKKVQIQLDRPSSCLSTICRYHTDYSSSTLIFRACARRKFHLVGGQVGRVAQQAESRHVGGGRGAVLVHQHCTPPAGHAAWQLLLLDMFTFVARLAKRKIFPTQGRENGVNTCHLGEEK